MARDWLGLARRALKKPPRVVLRRLVAETHAAWMKYQAPSHAAKFTERRLLEKTGHRSLDALWIQLAARPYVAVVRRTDREVYDALCPGDSDRILVAAEQALRAEVNLLGSGFVKLAAPIAWSEDFKTGFDWPNAYCRDIEYANLDRPSDVKIPWELSRMQWLIPVGQAYALTGDDRYAAGVRSVLESWIEANPYAYSVNWSCTMEVAIRIIVWTWFFYIFHDASSWQDGDFRSRFLRTLFLHVEFTEQNLEESDVNGNHYTADAAGLVFGGLFFGACPDGVRWHTSGWRILTSELPKQVFPDGVDYEASVPYHRLVLELFWLPSLYRRACGLPVSAGYDARIASMIDFVAAYVRQDGSIPLVGDGDDARTLPLGGQSLNDHRYLVGLGAVQYERENWLPSFGGARSEIFWLLGSDAAASLPERAAALTPGCSRSFPNGGFYVMCNARDHVFIDCGPLGLAGRGGHGHNDALSFEAVLDGCHLVTDCGSYLYTASFEERNRFRSTAYHNTPCVDGQEINRFIRPDYLWTLHDDAKPTALAWKPGPELDIFEGTHLGFSRLASPVKPTRRVILEHQSHTLAVCDRLEGAGNHVVEIPIHLTPGVEVSAELDDGFLVVAGARRFRVRWIGPIHWRARVEPCRVSPSYGVVVPSFRIIWRYEGPLPATLDVALGPAETLVGDLASHFSRLGSDRAFV
jgi:uncharacterized heparinase superfamily protein